MIKQIFEKERDHCRPYGIEKPQHQRKNKGDAPIDLPQKKCAAEVPYISPDQTVKKRSFPGAPCTDPDQRDHAEPRGKGKIHRCKRKCHTCPACRQDQQFDQCPLPRDPERIFFFRIFFRISLHHICFSDLYFAFFMLFTGKIPFLWYVIKTECTGIFRP